MPKRPKNGFFSNHLACMAWHQISNCCIVLLLLLMVECKCGGQDSEPSNQEQADPETPTPAPIPAGIWHTGTFAGEIKPTPPQNSLLPHLYNHTFHIYRVRHDGSCGFRSFIPILLADILVNNKWQAWLEKIRTTYYEPAQVVLKSIKDDLKHTNYQEDIIKLSKNPDERLKNIENLLQKLAQEPKPRPLQESEIKLLVKFLRQTFLMRYIAKNATKECLQNAQDIARKSVIKNIEENIRKGKNLEEAYREDSKATIEELKKLMETGYFADYPPELIQEKNKSEQKIREDIQKCIVKMQKLKKDYQADPEGIIKNEIKNENFYRTPQEAINNFFGARNRTSANFWATDHELGYLFIPYLCFSGGQAQLAYFYNGWNVVKIELFPKQPPTIWLYYHGGAFFDYLVLADDQSK